MRLPICREFEKVESVVCVISPSGHCRIRDSNNWVVATLAVEI